MLNVKWLWMAKIFGLLYQITNQNFMKSVDYNFAISDTKNFAKVIYHESYHILKLVFNLHLIFIQTILFEVSDLPRSIKFKGEAIQCRKYTI